MSNNKRELGLVLAIVLLFAVANVNAEKIKGCSKYSSSDSGSIPEFSFFNDQARYALLVGISEYEYWDDLSSPMIDVRRLRDHLCDVAKYDEVIVLTNKDATQSRIRELIVNRFAEKLDENDRFMFYFSGHGTSKSYGPKGNRRNKGYLVLGDSKAQDYSSMIDLGVLSDYSKDVSHSLQTLFVLDSCLSGLAGYEIKSARKYNINERAHQIITAGTAEQYTPGGGEGLQWQGSLFTHVFIEGISGSADSSTVKYQGDGVVSLSELHEYARKRINEYLKAQDADYELTPQVRHMSTENVGDFYFVYDESRAKSVVRTDGSKFKIEIKGQEGLVLILNTIDDALAVREILGQDTSSETIFKLASEILGETIRVPVEYLVDENGNIERVQGSISKRNVVRLQLWAEVIKKYQLSLRLEGHTDERGTPEYNYALGESRANQVKQYLVSCGVKALYLDTISYGEEMPVDYQSTDMAWAKNNRVELRLR